jgi:hypothetical protein
LKNAAEVMHAAQSSYFQDTERLHVGLFAGLGELHAGKSLPEYS